MNGVGGCVLETHCAMLIAVLSNGMLSNMSSVFVSCGNCVLPWRSRHTLYNFWALNGNKMVMLTCDKFCRCRRLRSTVGRQCAHIAGRFDNRRHVWLAP